MHVTVLSKRFRILKVQLSSLVKSHNSCGALSDCIASLEEPRYSGTYEVARKTQEDKCHCQVNNSLKKKVFCKRLVLFRSCNEVLGKKWYLLFLISFSAVAGFLSLTLINCRRTRWKRNLKTAERWTLVWSGTNMKAKYSFLWSFGIVLKSFTLLHYLVCDMWNGKFAELSVAFLSKKLSLYSWSLSSYVYYPVLLQFWYALC